MSDLYDDTRPDSYTPTLGDLAAALGLVLGAVTLVLWRRWTR